jgi:hypothetical protein
VTQAFQFFPFMSDGSHTGMQRKASHLAHYISELVARIALGQGRFAM